MNISNIIWSPELVQEWLEIAAKVERVLPPVGPKMAQARLMVVRDWLNLLWDELDEDEKCKEPRFYPTNEQITQWEIVVLRWFPLLADGRDKRILWWRACGMGWARIASRLHFERHTGMRRHKQALEELVRKLNAGL
ncbi:MAG: DUF6362 family protein [Alphaproteobacteria bacterium]|nr:DUF6362 family protein [Alphaproteobacteria bacterium]